ncbi:hypothetical protein IWQ61_010124 [Dispira simplex]|nr:hypothetical protein IWQ61_010124 [Dispira simplex]
MRFSKSGFCVGMILGSMAFVELQPVCATTEACQPGKWALTFDDGPDSSNSLALLDMLKKHNVRATFFIVGSSVESNVDILTRIPADDHEVAVHTWDQPDLRNETDDEIREQVNSTVKAIYETIGVKPTLMWPPYGSTNDRVNGIMSEFNLEYVDKYGDHKDAWEATKQEMFTSLKSLNADTDGAISLQHDKYRVSVEKIEEIITAIHAKGFTLSAVQKCIGYNSTLSTV